MVDLTNPDCVELVQDLIESLSERRITLSPHWTRTSAPDEERDEELDPFGIVLPTLVIATRADEIENIEQELEAFFDLLEQRFPSLALSSTTGEGIDGLGRWLFEALEIVRVYTKTPGKPPEHDRPLIPEGRPSRTAPGAGFDRHTAQGPNVQQQQHKRKRHQHRLRHQPQRKEQKHHQVST